MTENPKATIKLGTCHDVSGEWVWGPNEHGIACVRLEDGSTLQGQHMPMLAGLLDTEERDDG